MNIKKQTPTYIIDGRLYKRLNAVYEYAEKKQLKIIEMYQPNINRPFYIFKVKKKFFDLAD